MLKNIFLSEKKLLNAILRAKLKHMKRFLSNEWTVFAMQKTDFHVFELFCRKKSILELKMHKIHFLELLRTPILCFSATKQIMRMARPQMLKNILSQWEKVAKCNFKSKAQVHEKVFFLMKWTVFCNAEDRFSWCLSFFAEKVILELKCTKSLLYSF